MKTDGKHQEIFFFILFSLFFFSLTSWSIGTSQNEAPTESVDPLYIEAILKKSDLSPGETTTLEIKAVLPAGYHGYSDQLKLDILEPENFKMSAVKVEPEIEFFDKFSKKNRKGYSGETKFIYIIETAEKSWSEKQLKAILTYQACSESFCLFPVKKEFRISFIAPPESKGSMNFLSESNLEKALNENLLFGFLIVFLAGLLTSFTPCIFPMIPITLSVIGQGTLNKSRKESFLLSLTYVHGIAFTYSLLGLFAAFSGNLFGSLLGNKIILAVMCVIFLVMAFGMYGFYNIQVPLFIQNKLHTRKNQSGYIGAFVTGLVAGIVASPCVGPVLVSILAFVASTQNATLGFFLLFTYAMGLGVIFMILGLFSQVTKALPRSGAWMDVVKFVLGSLMLGVFFYYLQLLVDDLAWKMILILALLIMAWALKPLNFHNSLLRLRQLLSLGLILSALFLGATQIQKNKMHQMEETKKSQVQSRWQEYSAELLLKAKNENKPVLIDFRADWCAACLELEEKTFSTEEFETLTQNYILLKFDATSPSAELDRLKKEYKILGLPTVAFISSAGKIQHDITLTQFEEIKDFKNRLLKVK